MTTENSHQHDGERRSDASAPGAVRHGATPTGTGATPGPEAAPSLDEQIAQTMRASIEEKDPIKRSSLNVQLRALYEQRYPEETSGQDDTLKVTVPLTPEQAIIADAYAQDVSTLAKGTGADPGQVGALFDYAVSEAFQDVAEVTDPNACMNVLRTRYGSATDALVDDARRAVTSLGPQVKDYLEQTGAGNSPGVIQALAQWHRGHFKLSAVEARARMATEQDPATRRLLSMLAARS